MVSYNFQKLSKRKKDFNSLYLVRERNIIEEPGIYISFSEDSTHTHIYESIIDICIHDLLYMYM